MFFCLLALQVTKLFCELKNMFLLYSVVFGFAVAMTLRSLVNGDWDAVDAYFILAAFSFITLCDQLYWNLMPYLMQ